MSFPCCFHNNLLQAQSVSLVFKAVVLQYYFSIPFFALECLTYISVFPDKKYFVVIK